MRRSLVAMLVFGGAALACSGCLSWHRGRMVGEPAHATFAALEGARIRYIDVGEGPVVVLIHGFASSLDTWEHVVPALRPGHRVIALDLKGFGWSDRPEGDYSPAAQARIVLALLRELGVDRFALVAHSYGASVALRIALMVRQRVTRLALYDAFAYDDETPAFFRWARAPGLGEALFGAFYAERYEDRLALGFYDPDRVPQALVDAVGRAYDRPGTRAAALATVRGMDYAAIEERYREITQPVLVLWGREDATTPIASGERLERELPNAHLRAFGHCGHLPMIEAEQASTGELVRFLSADDATMPAEVTAEPTRAEGSP